MGSSSSAPEVGYHVLKVQPSSPGETAGLISFFDFIVQADGQSLESDGKLVEILKEKIDKELQLEVYNSREEKTRNVTIVPSSTWGGKGLLGISIRFCSLAGANEHVWHVLDVIENSPAYIAGLQPYVDYIVGATDILFTDSEDFFTLVQANMGKPVCLYVYNVASDTIRIVTLVPNKDWGGTGSLGCGVGYGYLHRIPHNRELALQNLGIEANSPDESPSVDPVEDALEFTPTSSSLHISSPTSSSPQTQHQNNFDNSKNKNTEPIQNSQQNGDPPQKMHTQTPTKIDKAQTTQTMTSSEKTKQKEDNPPTSPNQIAVSPKVHSPYSFATIPIQPPSSSVYRPSSLFSEPEQQNLNDDFTAISLNDH